MTMTTKTAHPALAVMCPSCRAAVGKPCRRYDGTDLAACHASRRDRLVGIEPEDRPQPVAIGNPLTSPARKATEPGTAGIRALAEWLETTEMDVPADKIAERERPVCEVVLYHFWLGEDEDSSADALAARIGGEVERVDHGNSPALRRHFGPGSAVTMVLPDSESTVEALDRQIAMLIARREELTTTHAPSHG